MKFEKIINYKLRTETAYKLFSNQNINTEIINKFQTIKNKVIVKSAQMKMKIERLKTMY